MRKILMKNDRMDSVRGADSSIGSAATFGAKAVRLFFVALTVVFCVGMWGCSDPCDDMEYVWTSQTEKKIVGFVNDTFAIVAHGNRWSYETDCMCSGERFGLGRWTIGIYNYREQQDGPVFVDSVDDGFGQYMYVLGQLSDSVVWGGDTDPNLLVWKNATSFSFWKIGEHPCVIEISQAYEGCSISFPISSLREWTGNFIFAKGNLSAGGDSCQYAVLDTVAQTLTYKRLDEDLKWIQKCDDVRAWGDDVYCLIRKKENWSVLLSVDDDVVDSMEFDGNRRYAVYPALFAGDMLHMGDYVCSLTNEKMERKPYVKSLSGLKFINADDSIVSY